MKTILRGAVSIVFAAFIFGVAGYCSAEQDREEQADIDKLLHPPAIQYRLIPVPTHPLPPTEET